MNYLFDTNVCIKILKGTSNRIQSKIANIKNTEIKIPSVVKFELFYGAYKSSRVEETLKIIKDFLNCFDEIGFYGQASEICGRIRAELEKKGTPIGPYDLQIAGIALANNLILVTHNVKEFSRVENLVIEDWE